MDRGFKFFVPHFFSGLIFLLILAYQMNEQTCHLELRANNKFQDIFFGKALNFKSNGIVICLPGIKKLEVTVSRNFDPDNSFLSGWMICKIDAFLFQAKNTTARQSGVETLV